MASLNTRTFNPDSWYDREFKSGTKFINDDTLLARITPCLENGKKQVDFVIQRGQHLGYGFLFGEGWEVDFYTRNFLKINIPKQNP
jgi:hypothetical protein